MGIHFMDMFYATYQGFISDYLFYLSFRSRLCLCYVSEVLVYICTKRLSPFAIDICVTEFKRFQNNVESF